MSLVSTQNVLERFRPYHPVVGDKFFVSPNDSIIVAGRVIVPLDSNDGRTPYTPKKTVTAALAAAGSDDGTIIFMMAGSYVENIVVTRDYVSLIGIVEGGYGRPDVVPAAGVALTVSGQGFVAKHVRFAATAADCVKQEGNGFIYDDCVFDGDATATKAGLRLRGNNTDDSLTASEGIVQNCLFRGNSIGLAFDSAAAPSGVGVTDDVIIGNRFYANTQDITAEKTGAGGVYSVQTTEIVSNYFADKNKTNYIDLTTNADGAAGSQTGTIAGNHFAADAIDGTRVAMAGTGFTFVGNFSTVGVVDGSGLD